MPAAASQVGYSAVVFYGYVGLIGLALWAMLKWWFKSDVSLPQVWCTYGAPAARHRLAGEAAMLLLHHTEARCPAPTAPGAHFALPASPCPGRVFSSGSVITFLSV